jgi:hypothetical protein
VLLATGIVLVALFFRVRNVYESLPYIRHVDEQTEANVALRMLRHGTTNPRRFNKPTLPAYVIAGSFWVAGLGQDGDRYEPVATRYPILRMAALPKLVFALASTLGLALVGLAAAVAFGRSHLAWLAPLCAFASVTYFEFSWTYLNVDILGAFFVMATVAFLVVSRCRTFEKFTGSRVFVAAGVLSGLTVGCKYNLFPIIFPCILHAWFFDRKRFVRHFVVLGVASLGAFLVTTPYALFDSREFLKDVLREVRHYATSHLGTQLDPGIPVLAKFGELLYEDFGAIPLAVAFLGAALAARRDPRTFSILFSFPVTFTLYMSAQRVFFARNAVSLPLFVAIALAYGLGELPGLLARHLAKEPRFATLEPALRRGAIIALAACTVVGLPWSTIAEAYRPNLESRNDAVRFIRANFSPGTKVLLDAGLEMDARSLEPEYPVEILNHERDVKRARRDGAPDGSISVVKASARKGRGKRSGEDGVIRFGRRGSISHDPRLEIRFAPR